MKKILAIGAHPDDIELGCAGTLRRFQILQDAEKQAAYFAQKQKIKLQQDALAQAIVRAKAILAEELKDQTQDQWVEKFVSDLGDHNVQI